MPADFMQAHRRQAYRILLPIAGRRMYGEADVSAEGVSGECRRGRKNITCLTNVSTPQGAKKEEFDVLGIEGTRSSPELQHPPPHTP